MIITSQVKLELGKVYSEQDLPAGTKFQIIKIDHEQYRFMVLREATTIEYDNYNFKEYQIPVDQFAHWEYYYEVSLD